MNKKFHFKLLVVFCVISFLLTLPTFVLANPNAKGIVDDSAKLDGVDGLRDLNDYREDYNKVSSKMKKATELFINGLIEYEKGDKKEARKEFEKANKKFKESKDVLADLDLPISVKRLSDLTAEALDKYVSGIKKAIKL